MSRSGCEYFLMNFQFSVGVYKQCWFDARQVSSYAIRDAEEYKNFCDRPKDQRPLPEEVIGVSLF